ncbi:MFS transporter [Caballeronia sp. LZ065]|uniref:MFS transporter n=1 Tax=Caballeronia sp. LZ065 TaxID=3038571 RepID=UPI00285A5D90|nr:MFS transporter [Caballeronia sp. LZ065]MDR5784632.1 MFS transporter [Caballeronia sp. LZ065]
MTQTVNSGGRLDRLPLSGFHWKMLALIAAGGMVDAFDIYLAGGVAPAMAKEGFSTLAMNAAFVSSTFLGMFIGAAFAGIIGDRFGRRVSYQANLLIFGLASLAAYIAPNIEALIGLRFLMGLGLGAELVIAAGTLSEFTPPAYRGRWGAALSLVIASGLTFSSWIGYFVIPTFGWRWMFIIAGVGAVAVWAMRKRMPESPRWLERVGRLQEAEVVTTAIERDVERRHGALPPASLQLTESGAPAPLRDLFAPALLPRLLVASLLIVTTNVSVYGFVVWLPTFFVEQGLTVTKSLGYTTTMAVGAIFGSLMATLIADKVTRVKAIVFSCLLLIVSATAFCQMKTPTEILVAGFCLVSSLYCLISIGQYNFVPEVFPTAYRLRGAGFASMCGRAAAIVTPFGTLALYKDYGVIGVLSGVGLLLCTLIVAVLVLRVETGRVSLEALSQEPALRSSGVSIRDADA